MNMPYIPSALWQHKPNLPNFKYFIIAVGVLLAIILFMSLASAETLPPEKLWMGIIAEDTSGDYQTYLVIASVVRNRLNKGLSHGLVALKRQNLGQFVRQNCNYLLKTKGIDLTKLATKAMTEVFSGKDFANGATHYEHTKIYGIPYWAKNLKVVKVIYPNTKREITFWK